MTGVQMRANADGVLLSLMGDVGWDITPPNVAAALKGQDGKKLTVSLHSYGGDALAGVAIHNMLARHTGHKTVIVEGVAASAASLIAMAGDRIVMPENAFLMIHEAWGGAIGDAATLRDQADLVERISASYRRTYAAKSGKPEEEVAALMAAETWFTADEAVAQGFATEAAPPADVRAMAVPMDRFTRVPAALAVPFTPPASPVPQEEVRVTEANIQAGAEPVAAAPVAPVPATLAQLRQIQSRAGLDAEWALKQAEAAVTVEQAKDSAIDAVAAHAKTAPVQSAIRVGVSNDDPARIIEAMGTAIAARAMPEVGKAAADDRWKSFARMRPSDMILELATARGERVTWRDRSRMVEAAFHTTSDFPLLLENAGNKMLEAGFAAANPSYRMIFAQRPFNDFKAHSFVTAGDFPVPTELAEGGEIAAGTISEKRERITPKTYARQVRITRQALVNDDLGAFVDFGMMIGRRIADFENATAYGVLNTANGDGPTLTTGNAAVFGTGATRLNKAGAGAAIAEASLDAGFAGIMAQTSIDGVRLNIQPAYVLTGAAYRGAALRFTTRAIVPASGANVAIYDMLTPVADANIPGNRWYLFADPMVAPVYVYGYVNGQVAPQIRVHQYVPGTDGLAVEVVHDFAVGAIDHRGGWFNAGA
jgi:ATP-dependent protease ClpP protease subunit